MFPRLALRQVKLFETLDPLNEIQSLDFVAGLNIVQGDADESAELFESGHGIGKTTLCRLIRYCLGEKSYGQKHVIAEVRHCFPTSYVGAVVEVDSQPWTVLRGLGRPAKHFAAPTVSFAELICMESEKPYSDFTDAVAAVVMNGMTIESVLSGGQSIQWLHLLALCSRDQESRYDRFWNWRHNRSESQSPKFAKPKPDAGLVVRSLLGILDKREPELRAKIETLEASLVSLAEDEKRKQLEPTVQMTSLRDRLRTEFEIEDAGEATVDVANMFGIESAANLKLKAIQDDLAQIERDLPSLNRKIEFAAAAAMKESGLHRQFSAASGATTAAADVVSNDLQRLREIKQALEDHSAVWCPTAESVTYGECSYVQDRLAKLRTRIAETEQEMAKEVSSLDRVASNLSAKANAQELERKRNSDERKSPLDVLTSKRDALLSRRIVLNDQLNRLPGVISNLQAWHAISRGEAENTELAEVMRQQEQADADLKSAKEELATLIKTQKKRAKSFQARFDQMVRKTINEKFRGAIDIRENGISFRITREDSLAGEAYETLAVLLADLTLLLESNAKKVRHPGFLLHDSPREADLNVRIYERLLQVASDEMSATGDEEPPFQYIVTTTTPPSETLAKSVKMHHLTSGSGSLFGRQLEGPKPDEQGKLFDTDEEGGAA